VGVVVSLDLIEHLTKPELIQFSQEVFRCLEPGGCWLIHAPNAEGPFGARIRFADLTHEQAFTARSIHQLADAIGFRSVCCHEDAPIIHGVKSLVRWTLWRFIRLVLQAYYLVETGSSAEMIFSQNLFAVLRKD